MILLGNTIITRETFSDGTLKINEPNIISNEDLAITWCYDDDNELFLLWSVVQFLREEHPRLKYYLIMPYIPNARQDRRVSGRLFTLRYFAQLINAMNFERVCVLDPHSDVSMALFDRVTECEDSFKALINCVPNVGDKFENKCIIVYPDNGAAKKYSRELYGIPKNLPVVVGNKHRDANGRIDKYEMPNINGAKTAIIIDDICSYGGTLVAAAKALREAGVQNIYACISHCENNIVKGEVFNYIDHVVTTDSICTVSNPKLSVLKLFREIKGE